MTAQKERDGATLLAASDDSDLVTAGRDSAATSRSVDVKVSDLTGAIDHGAIDLRPQRSGHADSRRARVHVKDRWAAA
jgi:hypothetical protein